MLTEYTKPPTLNHNTTQYFNTHQAGRRKPQPHIQTQHTKHNTTDTTAERNTKYQHTLTRQGGKGHKVIGHDVLVQHVKSEVGQVGASDLKREGLLWSGKESLN